MGGHNLLCKTHIEMIEIYALTCPTSGAIRYIGKANNSVKRYKSHMRDSRRRNTPVYRWIRKLAMEGRAPNMKVLETVPIETWQETETRLIAEYSETEPLLNVAPGGDEPFCNRETRAANGRKNAKEIHSNPTKRRLWRLRRFLGQNLLWLQKNGSGQKATEIRARLRKKQIIV